MLKIDLVVKLTFLTFCVGLLLISSVSTSSSVPLVGNVKYVQAQELLDTSNGGDLVCGDGLPPLPDSTCQTWNVHLGYVSDLSSPIALQTLLIIWVAHNVGRIIFIDQKTTWFFRVERVSFTWLWPMTNSESQLSLNHLASRRVSCLRTQTPEVIMVLHFLYKFYHSFCLIYSGQFWKLSVSSFSLIEWIRNRK